MKNSVRCPLFVFGYPRSGTTLLWSLLNAHSEIRLVLEPELIRGMLAAGLKFSEHANRKGYAGLLEKMRRIGLTRRHLDSLADEKLSEFINHSENLSFREIYEFLLPKPTGAKIWGEKSLGNSFHIGKLHEIYPNAAFVHIVRDPRAVLLSHYRKKFSASKPSQPRFGSEEIRFFAQGAMLWKRWNAAVEKGCQNMKDATFIQFRYRDIVGAPEKYLRLICGKLGVEFEPQMLEVKRRSESSSVKSEFAYAHRNLIKPINANRAKANLELPGWASYIVEKYAAGEIKKFDFPLSENRCGLSDKLKIEAQLLVYGQKLHFDVKRKIAMRRRVYNL